MTGILEEIIRSIFSPHKIENLVHIYLLYTAVENNTLDEHIHSVYDVYNIIITPHYYNRNVQCGILDWNYIWRGDRLTRCRMLSVNAAEFGNPPKDASDCDRTYLYYVREREYNIMYRVYRRCYAGVPPVSVGITRQDFKFSPVCNYYSIEQ